MVINLKRFGICLLPDDNEAEMREKAPDDEGEEESDDDADNEDEVITEIRFVPSDKAACECVHLVWFLTLNLISSWN